MDKDHPVKFLIVDKEQMDVFPKPFHTKEEDKHGKSPKRGGESEDEKYYHPTNFSSKQSKFLHKPRLMDGPADIIKFPITDVSRVGYSHEIGTRRLDSLDRGS